MLAAAGARQVRLYLDKPDGAPLDKPTFKLVRCNRGRGGKRHQQAHAGSCSSGSDDDGDHPAAPGHAQPAAEGLAGSQAPWGHSSSQQQHKWSFKFEDELATKPYRCR